VKKYNLAINGNPYSVRILEVTTSAVCAEVNGVQHTVAIENIENISMFPAEASDSRPRSVTPPATPKSSGSSPANNGGYCLFESQNVEAPIPGQIITIDVQPGDHVKKGQRVLILEAMKMENALLAKRDAVVKEVLVVRGEAVTQDQPLILFV
jgi:biotin carboxyl carrier protein